ncbi:MAG TPA: twin-arginine translocase TatA/TatE family subunit [Tissierellaceae bacterium]
MRLGFSELLLILLIILLLFGAKKLPELGKALGDTTKQVRKLKEEKENEVKDEENVEG